MSIAALADRVRQGDPRALARAISLVEAEGLAGAALLAALHPHAGGSVVVGLTGPPGVGKSTLVDRLTGAWRSRGHRVGVIAVDPSSPFTGGALLGDRVRMQGHAGDEGVFIRSMATRGHLGGLARATSDVALVLAAAQHAVVVIETVGVGQDEIDVVRTADVSVVVLAPGAGDEVQALKAGIMEIADIYVVNKADHAGADATVASVETLLSLGPPGSATGRPPIVRTEAVSGVGLAALVDGIDRVLGTQAATLGSRRRSRCAARIRDLVARQLMAHVERDVLAPGEFDALLDCIDRHETDPHSVASAIVARVVGPR